jgi:hypothetical protein
MLSHNFSFISKNVGWRCMERSAQMPCSLALAQGGFYDMELLNLAP